jgi:hypothetical protein
VTATASRITSASINSERPQRQCRRGGRDHRVQEAISDQITLTGRGTWLLATWRITLLPARAVPEPRATPIDERAGSGRSGCVPVSACEVGESSSRAFFPTVDCDVAAPCSVVLFLQPEIRRESTEPVNCCRLVSRYRTGSHPQGSGDQSADVRLHSKSSTFCDSTSSGAGPHPEDTIHSGPPILRR